MWEIITTIKNEVRMIRIVYIILRLAMLNTI